METILRDKSEKMVDSFFSKVSFHHSTWSIGYSLSFCGCMETYAPPQVVALAWLTLSGCILTTDNSRKQNIILVNGCPMGLKEAESIDHLLVSLPLVWPELGDALFPWILIPSMDVFSSSG